MMTEIEKQFFTTFEIKASMHKTSAVGVTEINPPRIFPEITDRIILGLININVLTYGVFESIYPYDLEDFKYNIRDYILAKTTSNYVMLMDSWKLIFKARVQKLFEGGNVNIQS